MATRAAAINIRALPDQRNLIDYAAALMGRSRSDFMLEAACERAQSVILDQVHFSLDAAEHQRFLDMLYTPPSAELEQGLQRLLAVQAPWDKP